MADRTRNAAEKRKGQLPDETAKMRVGTRSRMERREIEVVATPPKRKGRAGKAKGRGRPGRTATTR